MCLCILFAGVLSSNERRILFFSTASIAASHSVGEILGNRQNVVVEGDHQQVCLTQIPLGPVSP